MTIFKKAIPRRTFLRGAGTVVALPLLDSMVPAFAGALDPTKKPATRLSITFGPNGRIMRSWTPKTEGTNFEMTPTLEPFAPFRDQLNVITGLNIKAADAVGNEPGGVHARPAAAYLTGIHPKPGGAVGVSMDQMAAKYFSKDTQLASLELGLDSPEVGTDDGVYATYYMNTIAWRTGAAPLPTENNPRSVFERMFGDSDSADPAERLRMVKKQKSVLDSVTEGVANLMKGVGPADRVKLTEYLDSIRDLERRIAVAEKSSGEASDSSGMARPVGIPITFEEHAKLMYDLQVLAFQTDMTRVITFMLGREQTDRNYREIGVPDGHHPLSHHKEMEENIKQVEMIDLHHAKMYAYFLNKLKNTKDGDGSLLDHSILMYGSSLSDGNFHIHNNVPLVLVGGGSGALKGGRHIKYQGQPLTNMHLTVLDMLKVPVEGYLDSKYSDATGKLDLLTV